MTRPIPKPVVAWQADGVKRPYRRPLDVYYQLAKVLVLAKYGVDGPIGGDEWEVDANGNLTGAMMEPRQIDANRLRKKHLLFYSNSERHNPDPEAWTSAHFDERLWRAFVLRVAKFLAFVDRRRSERGMLERLSNEQLQSEFDDAERNAGVFMDRASAVKSEIERRRR